MNRIKKILIPIFAVVGVLALSLAITGCGGNGLAKQLDMPLNVTIELNQRKSGTQYILNWDAVEGANGYSISIDGRTMECEKNTFDATNYVTPGVYSGVHVKALGNGVSTADSDLTKAVVRVEIVSSVLLYKTNNEEKTVSVFSYATDKEALAGRIVIPDYYNGMPITEIAENAFFDNNATYRNPITGENCNNMTSSFRLPSKLEKIGAFAFAFCTIVKDMKLPATLKTIEEGAFAQCIRLASVNLNNVENIGASAFAYCKALATAELSQNLQTLEIQAFAETPVYNNMVGDKIFGNRILCELADKELEEYTVPENITLIASGAFMDMKKLKSVTLHENVKFGGSRIFANCTSLEQIAFPKNITQISDYTFAGCKSITEAVIPDTVVSIGYAAFANCEKLTSLTLNKNLTEIGEGAFQKTAIETITLPDGLKTIHDYAFSLTSLKEIVIPDSVRTIGKYAFAGCNKLDKITLGENLTEIGEYAFYLCPLTTAVLPKGITTLKSYTYYSETISYVVLHNRFKTIYLDGVCTKYGCPVYFEGTKEEFDKITFVPSTESGIRPIAFTDVRYYSETKPDSETGLTYWRWVDGVPADWTNED